MRSKAIKQLAQLSDDEMFEFISEGMNAILINALIIESDAQELASSGRIRGARILRLFAEEEAAKFLILMDVVRCKRASCEFSRQLKYFYDHLAKRIYAWSCTSNQSDLLSVRKTIEFFRKESYIHPGTGELLQDGEQIPDEREDTLYIDCLEEEGELKWTTPARIDEVYQRLGLPKPYALLVIGALHYSGFTSGAALRIIADRWRKVEITDDYDYARLSQSIKDTIEDMRRADLLTADAEDHLPIIQERWFFPLYGLELTRMKKQDVDDAAVKGDL